MTKTVQTKQTNVLLRIHLRKFGRAARTPRNEVTSPSPECPGLALTREMPATDDSPTRHVPFSQTV